MIKVKEIVTGGMMWHNMLEKRVIANRRWSNPLFMRRLLQAVKNTALATTSSAVKNTALATTSSAVKNTAFAMTLQAVNERAAYMPRFRNDT